MAGESSSAASAKERRANEAASASSSKDGPASSPSKAAAARRKSSSDGIQEGDGPVVTDQAVLEYLRARGFQKLEVALKAELKDGKPSTEGAAKTMDLDELASKNAPKDTAAAASSTSTEPKVNLEELAIMALKTDKTDRIRGFGMVRNWAEGGLDVYQAELRPLLLPLFVHAYLDLIEMGSQSAAFSLYSLHSSALRPQHSSLLVHLRSITLEDHLATDDLVQRFRSERFVLKMSQTVFGLLLGWLTDGTGPIAGAGSAEGVGGDGAEAPATRGRLAMLRIINERCRIEVLRAKPYDLTPSLLQEGTGLTGTVLADPSSSSSRTSTRYPALQASAVAEGGDAIAEYNARNAGPQLKLGPRLPMGDRLKEEVDRELAEEKKIEDEERKAKELEQSARDDDSKDAATTTNGDEDTEMEGISTERQPSQQPETTSPRKSREPSTARATQTPGRSGSKAPTASVAPAASQDAASASTSTATASDLLQPEVTDLLPQPPVFRTVDIMREVSRVRDARKALRIDLNLLNRPGATPTSLVTDDKTATDLMRRAALPSVCAYTYHDVDDGLTCSTFSEDLSLMAAGFEESYVQVWSMKGEPLRGLGPDVNLTSIRDSTSLGSQRLPADDALPTRKLIGHSAPVYALSFDPVGGSASTPRTLLSASGDSTVRLWSMDTFSALVSYRGHLGPVWDAQYGPAGIYFASGGMDKTARLWSTERVSPLRMYVGHLSDVDCLSFHPNSLYLATGSSDCTSRLWDVQRGANVRLFVGHSSPISSLKISPDGRYLATAGSGFSSLSPSTSSGKRTATSEEQDASSISIWDLGSGKRIKRMWGHQGRVDSLDFSTDGGLLISGGADCTVRCWDVRSAGGARTSSSSAGAAGVATTSMSKKGNGTLSMGGAGSSTWLEGGASGQQLPSSADCVATFKTKKTPVVDVKMTKRNLCLVAGGFDEAL